MEAIKVAQQNDLFVTQTGDVLVTMGVTNVLEAPGIWMTLDEFIEGATR